MSLTTRKIRRDLAHNKIRTLLVVLSTAVGLFALGLVFGLSNLIQSRVNEDYPSRDPAHLTFFGGNFDQEALEAIQGEPGIAQVAGEARMTIRWKKEGDTGWRDGNLIALPNYHTQVLNRIDLEEGAWPGDRTLALERQSGRYFNIPVGVRVIVEIGRSQKALSIYGAVRDPNVFPPQLGGDATFYTTLDTITWITGLENYNLAQAQLVKFDPGTAEQIAKRVEDRMDRMGRPVGGHFTSDPTVYPLQDTLNTLTLILGALGALSLGLGAFLIINTMNSIIAQQVWQIGVMKVVGATFGRVARLYLLTAVAYGALACLIAIPLGVFGSNWMAAWLLDYINIKAGPFQILPEVIGLQIALGLLVPMLAALIPVIGGARITPHQAISSYGLGAGFGHSPLDRIITAIRGLPRPLALSLRNTFRRKGRVALTLLTLSAGGLMFIVVQSVDTSMNNTLEVLINEFGFDAWIAFDETHHVSSLLNVARSTPGVERAEVWDQREAKLSLKNGSQRTIYLMGLPSDSEIFNPRIVAGRSLLAGDERAILLNNKIAKDEGIHVGDEIIIHIRDQEYSWTVVGLVLSVSNNQQDCFVPLSAMSRVTGMVNRGSLVMVTSVQHGPGQEQRLSEMLREKYRSNGFKPAVIMTSSEVRRLNRAQFDIVTNLMLAMAILSGVVGSFGLTGTMSINVIERGREIGVMRAIGATSFAIASIFIFEGTLLGLLSWVLAIPFSYPGALVFSSLIGQALLKVPLDFRYSTEGAFIWLGVVALLSILASILPASRAMRMSVRETLAYE